VLYLLIVLVAGGFVGGFFWLYTSLPIIEGALAVANGPSAPIEILRDRRTVPHIFADSQEDAYYGLGFVHAQDRLWQMEMMRRLAAGRLAEVAGRKALASDRFMRTLGFQNLAEKQYATLDDAVRRALDAYAAGVNAWMGATIGAFPPEFVLTGFKPEPWRPTDSLLWAKFMALRLSGNWRDELLRARLAGRLSREQIAQLWPAYPTDGPISGQQTAMPWDGMALDALAAALPISPPGMSGASNSWVVGGAYTETGKPILASDPHLGFQAPVLWYLARIEAPGLHVAGATAPGVPFTILGHNERIAWGMTSTQSDLQDLFVETVDPDDPGRYLTPDGPRRFITRTEVIRVRGGDDVTLNVRKTRHGPVISDVMTTSETASGGKVLAISATFLADDDLTPQAIYRLNRAQGWKEFLDAMRDFHSPQQNFVYADVSGAIGFLAPGRVPIRRGRVRGRVPGPGASGKTDWTGFIPFDELPRTLNPPSGRIVNANNRIVSDDYPHYITDDWAAPYRARRIIERLDEGKRQTLESTARIQLDALSLMARDLLPRLLAIKAPSGAAEQQALKKMRAWDGVMARERAEPLIFTAWLRELNRSVYGDELGPLLADYWTLRPAFMASVLDGRFIWCDDVRTSGREDCSEMISGSLKRSLAQLAASFGADRETWRWGAAHPASFTHSAFANIPILGRYTNLAIESDGGNYTVNRGASRISDEENPFANVHGPGFRAIYDLADLSRSRFMIATGQSGNPMSPFYGDMLKGWRDGESHELGTDRVATRRKAKGVLMLIAATLPAD
jgi:penicillin amidase